jgi:FMN phosphatase YigB (HAD superfamily)
MKALVVFDLDGTLAPSKSAIDAEMGADSPPQQSSRLPRHDRKIS